MTARSTRGTRRVLRASIAALVTIAVCVSVARGTPRDRPQWRLAGRCCWHAERVLAVVGVVVATVSVLAQARRRLPIELPRQRA